MNIFDRLKEDHAKVRELMAQVEQSEDGGSRREALFQQMKKELLAHAHAEETTFYDAIEDEDELEGRISEARAEHELVERLIEGLERMDAASDDWLPKFRVLKESVERHTEEEEGEIFSLARDLIGHSEAEELGERLESREHQLRTQA